MIARRSRLVGPIGFAVALLATTGAGALADGGWREIGRFADARVDWVATDGRLVAFGSDREVLVADVASFPVIRDRFTADDPVRGARLLGGRLHFMKADLRSGGSSLVDPLDLPTIATAGRLRFLASGDAGLILVRNDSPQSIVHPVNVLNDFFSPQAIEIAPGDTVQWTNAAGFHNVFSCNPEQLGCEEIPAAIETFESGPPADPLWFYSYTFTLAGENPYICQSHAPFMTGLVTVTPSTPPAVPDGRTGSPMTARKLDPAGDVLALEWDTTTCPGAVDTQLLYGVRSLLPADPGGIYRLSGSMCSIGDETPYVWTVPALVQDPHAFLWWLIVATDGAVSEGSWGTSSRGTERSGPGPQGSSGECGVHAKDLSNPCGASADD